MAINSPLSQGPLKGEITLSNGSKIVFDAPVWKLSYHQSIYGSCDSFLQAEERSQSNNDVIGVIAKDINDLYDSLLAETVKKNKEQQQLLEEACRLLSDNNVFLREYQIRVLLERIGESLGDQCEFNHSSDLDILWEIVKELSESNTAAAIGGHERCIFCKAKGDLISNLKHDPACIISKAYGLVWEKENREWHERKNKQETYCFGDAIGEARKTQGPSKVPVITNGEVIVRCQFASISLYIFFKDKECIGIHDNTHEIREKYNIDLSKGWYPAEINDAVWARAQSLTELQCKIDKNNKKQQKNTLFSLRLQELIMLVIGRASMCWSEMPRGVYDDTKAAKIGEKLVNDIIKLVEEKQ